MDDDKYDHVDRNVDMHKSNIRYLYAFSSTINDRYQKRDHHERAGTPWLRDMKFSQGRWCKRRISWQERIFIDVQRISNEIPRRIIYLQMQSMWTCKSVSQCAFLLWDHVFSGDALKLQKHVKIYHTLVRNMYDVSPFVFLFEIVSS